MDQETVTIYNSSVSEIEAPSLTNYTQFDDNIGIIGGVRLVLFDVQQRHEGRYVCEVFADRGGLRRDTYLYGVTYILRVYGQPVYVWNKLDDDDDDDDDDDCLFYSFLFAGFLSVVCLVVYFHFSMFLIIIARRYA